MIVIAETLFRMDREVEYLPSQEFKMIGQAAVPSRRS